LRVTKVGDAPLRLLRHVRELELVAHTGAQDCCGFGGTFALKNAETSSAMLDDKCAALERAGASWCTALDSSCLLHIGGGLSRRRSPTRPIHLAEILASS
jgi:L-lactate dehydrogenase complex protein LldE